MYNCHGTPQAKALDCQQGQRLLSEDYNRLKARKLNCFLGMVVASYTTRKWSSRLWVAHMLPIPTMERNRIQDMNLTQFLHKHSIYSCDAPAA